MLTLNFQSNTTTTLSQVVCTGSSYNFNGQILNTPGNYTDTLTGFGGCDSIINLTLSVAQHFNTFINRAICNGTSILFGGQTITTAGTYVDTLTATTGCDSFIIMTVDTFATSASAISKTICNGSSYTFAGQTLNTTGIYYDSLSNMGGCDSVVTLTLTVLNPITTLTTQSICIGTSILFGGQTITAAGTYTDTLTSATGCDSVVILTVNLVQPSSTSLNQHICNGTSYIFAGQVLNTSGTYSDTLTNAAGCDSVVTLTLVVMPTSASTLTQKICGNNGYNFNGQTLNTTGTYIDTLTNSVGCDSIVTLTLLVVPVYYDSTSVTLCAGNTYLFNGQNLITSGIYRNVLTSVSGCDSTIVLNLTVVPAPVAAFQIQPQAANMPLGNIMVNNLSTGGGTYTWQLNGENTELLNGNQIPVTQAGNYCITLTAAIDPGCTDTTTRCILVYNNTFFIPNAFTPNGDGVNDYLQLFATPAGIKYFSISVFNRWGEKVFESTNPGFQWDGTYKGALQAPGVFIYNLDIAYTNGNLVHDKGGVTLIR